jgi:hypothetical protein
MKGDAVGRELCQWSGVDALEIHTRLLFISLSDGRSWEDLGRWKHTIRYCVRFTLGLKSCK